MGKKQKNCDPAAPDDDHRGDYRDHVAYDPEHKLALAVVPGARTEGNARAVVAEVAERVNRDPPPLMTSDEYPAYATAIQGVFSEPVPAPPRRKPGRPRIVPERRLPDDVIYATVHKHRENGHVIAVEQRRVFGSAEAPEEVLSESTASRPVNTSFVERQNGTDRGRNARKARKTYRFSKDWQVHEAMTYLTPYSYNFCWCVRTLRLKDEQGRWQQRSPALAAKLTDHVWTWSEWFNRPAVQLPWDTTVEAIRQALKPIEFEIVWMHSVDDLTFPEIASVLRGRSSKPMDRRSGPETLLAGDREGPDGDSRSIHIHFC